MNALFFDPQLGYICKWCVLDLWRKCNLFFGISRAHWPNTAGYYKVDGSIYNAKILPKTLNNKTLKILYACTILCKITKKMLKCTDNVRFEILLNPYQKLTKA
jgi:hypothetical protein